MRKAVFLVLLLGLSLILPHGEATVSTQTRYFTTSQGLYFFDLSSEGRAVFDTIQDYYGTGSDYATRTVVGDRKVQFGIRVYHLDAWGNMVEITSGSPVAIVERINGVNAEGIQNATWDCPETTLARNEILVLEVYNRYYTTSWQIWWGPMESTTFLISAWASEGLGMVNLTANTWTVYYYTYRNYVPTSTTLRFYFGNATYNSHIEGIGVEDGVNVPENNLAVGLVLGLVIALPIALIFALSRKH